MIANPHTSQICKQKSLPMRVALLNSLVLMTPFQSNINQNTKKKGEYEEQNGKTHIQEDKRTT
jgi:hypothetical protein